MPPSANVFSLTPHKCICFSRYGWCERPYFQIQVSYWNLLKSLLKCLLFISMDIFGTLNSWRFWKGFTAIKLAKMSWYFPQKFCKKHGFPNFESIVESALGILKKASRGILWKKCNFYEESFNVAFYWTNMHFWEWWLSGIKGCGFLTVEQRPFLQIERSSPQ